MIQSNEALHRFRENLAENLPCGTYKYDFRGRKVMDLNGNEIGIVADDGSFYHSTGPKNDFTL
jgi:hypothetical protein